MTREGKVGHGTGTITEAWEAKPSDADQRQVGGVKAKTGAVHERTRQIQVDANLSSHRRRAGYMIVSIFIGVSVHLAGCFTIYFYRFNEEIQSQTSEGDVLFRVQEVGVSLNGVFLEQEFCDDQMKNCLEDISQYRYFDDSLNPPSLQWTNIKESDSYVTPVEKAWAASDLFINVTVFAFALVSVAACTMFAGMSASIGPKITRHWYLFVIFLHFLSCSSLGGALYNLNKQYEPLILALNDHPLLPSSEPTMRISTSFWMCAGGVISLAFGLYPLIRSIPDWGDVGAKTRLMAERDKRVASYFMDLSNSTHDLEQHPVDTAKAAVRMPGWTLDVQTTPTNQFSEPISTRGYKDKETGDWKPGINPDLEGNHEAAFSGQLDYKKGEKARKNLFEKQGPMPPPQMGTAHLNSPPPFPGAMGDIARRGSLPGQPLDTNEDALKWRRARREADHVERTRKVTRAPRAETTVKPKKATGDGSTITVNAGSGGMAPTPASNPTGGGSASASMGGGSRKGSVGGPSKGASTM